ncbi:MULTISPECIES: carbohydrate ABC transporter permease [Paenibacillus]|uniref:Carbohydrate ABC transporter permease n=1 Tax=Paenibacillus radicis (ex Xue et al. 2023) TaxID=2972489 RepID=A0ABT1YLW4_9BACL|nr:carbohydrate ABC transporter permease [Paenibacillus radicis (ex Xue et al. 2023)]MCR8634176.1 carbohydrate ABC transporter permease [Paenibacillus radicis (ex Xue et al. 2023)]
MTFGNRQIKSFLYHLMVGGLALVMLYPILWLAASSLKPNSEIFSTAYSLIPSRLEFNNYVTGWKGFAGNTFGTFFKNSFIIVILSTIGAVASSALVAYGLARIPFKGKGFWFGCVMMTMMLPHDVTIIPQYVMFAKLGWLSSFKPIIIPSFFGYPFFIFLIMQFIRTIPHEMDEAAKIDGCNKYSIFFRIIVPLIVPSLVTSTIFSFYWKWDDFINPLLYLSKPSLYPVSLALKLFLDGDSLNNWGGMFAMSTASLLPIIIVFFIFQKFIVEGISTSGLKG